MRAKQLGKTLNDRELNALVHPLRFLDNRTNLLCLLADYLTLIAILAPTIAFLHMRGAWGIPWYWVLPVVPMAVLLIGGVQHRLAGLGHEGAHYILLKNRLANELVSDVFCMFPLFTTTQQYRMIHLGHHEFTNDWERDPELVNLGRTRHMDRFPMTRWEFVQQFFVRILWPPALLRYMWDNIYVSVLGSGRHPYETREPDLSPPMLGPFRLTTLLGLGYFSTAIAVMGLLSYFGTVTSLIAVPLGLWLAACGVISVLPEKWFFQAILRPVYSPRAASMLRLGCLTMLVTVLAWLRRATGFEWGIYFWLLWVLPLFTSFPYYMLLRDLYQHANADDGKLTNSRVVFCNPLLRWAMFIYGQDIHLTHHLYPAVPHYNLPKLHRLLMEHNEEYASHVVECHGVLWNSKGKPTLLDCMENPTCEPAAETPAPAAEFPLHTHGLRRHGAEAENGWREHEGSLARS